jgi:gamma-glutamyl hercynylcysteine S-oxide synthase
MPLGGVESLLEEARERTLSLVEPVSDEDLDRQHHPLMSPLVWDLGHIAAFEDLWVCRQTRLELLLPELADLYDAAETPRAERVELPYQVGAFIGEMLLQHEHQHNETMLQTLQLAEPGVYAPERQRPAGPAATGSLVVEARTVEIGFAGEGFAYDNERPRHRAELGPYRIDRAPVTNAQFLAFVEDGGYRRRELWSDEGWSFREREGWERPLYWTAHGEERRFDRVEPLARDLPVMHVSAFEADAYARWRGGRLPTEAEWEHAASLFEPERGELDQLGFGPGPAGPFVGDCWEWTASEFDGYPGFEAYPYREYSEVFFGEGYRVLRGGAWATRTRVARPTFRNWDHPQRRQIFAGFRCAEDVGPKQPARPAAHGGTP